MAEKLQSVRGTHDILPDDFEKFQAVVTRARDMATLYGFREMATPIFEMTEVFKRSMGETSDVVSKEMFAFDTKGGESVCLRPEFTAGIARAFISNGMQQNLPLKIFSTGPLFRYERPQKGRQRQFHQVNFEWLGDDSAEADVEIIMLAGQLLHMISGENSCTLLINTLGDKESRAIYRDALVAYLTPHTANLSEDSQRRLIANPLRILDSKDPRDQEITKNAPKITDYLSAASKARFDAICKALKENSLAFFQEIRIEPSLVRGLDYYTDTVFEFVANTGDLGAQNTVLAGGRYDGLVEQMGGKPTPAIGFAAGVERLLLLAEGNTNLLGKKGLKIVVLPFEEVEKGDVHNIASLLRFNIGYELIARNTRRECSVETFWAGKLAKRMEKAAKQGADFVLILPPEEMVRNACVLQNMQTREKKEIVIADIKDSAKLAGLLGL